MLGLQRRIGPPRLGSVVASALRHGVAAAVMGSALWAAVPAFAWERGGNDPRTIGGLALLVVLGACVYAASAFALRVPELRELRASMRRPAADRSP